LLDISDFLFIFDRKMETPSFVVHLDKLKANCKRMLENAQKANILVRPHIKTHKTIEGAIYQNYGELSERNDGRIVVSTLQEAQVLLRNEIINPFSSFRNLKDSLRSFMQFLLSLRNLSMQLPFIPKSRFSRSL
jgi:hypothetical protein